MQVHRLSIDVPKWPLLERTERERPPRRIACFCRDPALKGYVFPPCSGDNRRGMRRRPCD